MFFNKYENKLIKAIDEEDLESIDDLILQEYHLEFDANLSSSYLLYAIEYGHTDSAIKLIQAGVDLETNNHENNNPLIKAAEMGNNQILDAIIKKNVIPLWYKDSIGKTALDYAKEQKNNEAIQMLNLSVCTKHKDQERFVLKRQTCLVKD